MTTVIDPAVTGLLTAEEFLQRHAGQRVELDEGLVREVAMPTAKHGRICFRIARLLEESAERLALGRVMTSDSFVKTRSNPDTVRGADVSYYSFERLPAGPIPDGLLPVAPDLVVEVRSPSDGWAEVFTKVSEFLRAGVRAVIVLDAGSTSASVYRMNEVQHIYHNGDELVVPEILPGFAVAVAHLFGG